MKRRYEVQPHKRFKNRLANEWVAGPQASLIFWVFSLIVNSGAYYAFCRALRISFLPDERRNGKDSALWRVRLWDVAVLRRTYCLAFLELRQHLLYSLVHRQCKDSGSGNAISHKRFVKRDKSIYILLNTADSSGHQYHFHLFSCWFRDTGTWKVDKCQFYLTYFCIKVIYWPLQKSPLLREAIKCAFKMLWNLVKLR